MFLALVFGPWLYRKLRELQIGQCHPPKKGRRSTRKKLALRRWVECLIVFPRPVPWCSRADLANPFVLHALFAHCWLSAGIAFSLTIYAKVSKQRNLGLTAQAQIPPYRFD